MSRKRKGDGDGIDEVPSKKEKRPPPRNRASPSSLLLACKEMNDDRKAAIDDMDLTSLRNIQRDHLFNNLSVWLAGLYDPNSREVVVPGRGRLPVNEEYVHRVMGVPHGGKDVPYNLPSEADIELGLELFRELGYAPKMTDLVDLIKGSENSMILSSRAIDGIKNLNWSKFIADELHKALLKRKPTRGCLLFYNLLYIHAIDLYGLGIVLPDGPFPINVWTKKLITLVLNKDVQANKVSSGKLQIVARFMSAMAGILGNLVESFTALDDEGHSDASRQLDAGLDVLSSAAHMTSRTTRSSQGRRPESAGKNVAEDSDSDDEYHGGNDYDSDANSDDGDDYRVVRRRHKDPFVASGSGTVDVDMGSGPADDDTTHLDGATVKAHDGTGPDVEDTPVRPVDDNLNESQILLTGTSHAASVKSGDGGLSQQGLTDTQAEAATESSVKRAPGKQSVAAKDSGIAPVKSRSKDKTVVKKVKFAKTRSSPRLRATLSQTTSSETTEVIHLDESPTATSPSEKAAASSKGASDAVAVTSAGVSDDAIFQLAIAAIVTAVVEDIASVAVAVECENEVVPNRVHDGSEAVRVTEKVVGGTRVNMPIDTATAGGQENDAHNPIGTAVADPTLESSTPGAGEYDGNFTPPNCSLGLDAIFGASPQVPPSTEATATVQATPALAQVPPAAPQASAAAPSAQVPPAAPATGPVVVLGLAAPVDAGSKGKAVMKVTKAQPVAWAPPPNSGK
ncbi:hypothetical protein VPH35_053740 [Triticum aestivum]